MVNRNGQNRHPGLALDLGGKALGYGAFLRLLVLCVSVEWREISLEPLAPSPDLQYGLLWYVLKDLPG
jgi:hypothetical protein